MRPWRSSASRRDPRFSCWGERGRGRGRGRRMEREGGALQKRHDRSSSYSSFRSFESRSGRQHAQGERGRHMQNSDWRGIGICPAHLPCIPFCLLLACRTAAVPTGPSAPSASSSSDDWDAASAAPEEAVSKQKQHVKASWHSSSYQAGHAACSSVMCLKWVSDLICDRLSMLLRLAGARERPTGGCHAFSSRTADSACE